MAEQFDPNAYVQDLNYATLNDIVLYGANLATAEQRKAASDAAKRRMNELRPPVMPTGLGMGSEGTQQGTGPLQPFDPGVSVGTMNIDPNRGMITSVTPTVNGMAPDGGQIYADTQQGTGGIEPLITGKPGDNRFTGTTTMGDPTATQSDAGSGGMLTPSDITQKTTTQEQSNLSQYYTGENLYENVLDQWREGGYEGDIRQYEGSRDVLGLDDATYQMLRSDLSRLGYNLDQGNINEQQYTDGFWEIVDKYGIEPIQSGTDKTRALDPGRNVDVYGARGIDVNIAGNFGDEGAGIMRRFAQTEGEGPLGRFNEASTLLPLIASFAGPYLGLGPIGTGLLTAGTAGLTGSDLEAALLQGLAAGTGAYNGFPGLGADDFVTNADLIRQAATGSAFNNAITQYYMNQDGESFTGSGVTPYETRAIPPGSVPNDFKDVNMSDPLEILNATRFIIDAGLPIPSWGMKLEDLKKLPESAWTEIKGWIEGSSNPLETIDKIFGGGLDKAKDIYGKIIDGGTAIIDILDEIFGNGGETEETPLAPPVGGEDVDEEEDVVDVTEDTTAEDPIGSDVETEADIPVTGEDIPPEIEAPVTTTETPTTTEESPVSGSLLSGAGVGIGDFDPFQTGISYNVPMVSRVNTQLRNFLAELYARG